jgi:hypothetical protein
MIRSDLVAGLMVVAGFIVWLIQRKVNQKTAERLQLETQLADERAQVVEVRRAALAESYSQVLNRLTILEKKGSIDSQTLAMIKQEMLPMAEAMKRKLIDLLQHPSKHFHIPDVLLEKVREVGAALPEELLPILLERRTSDDPHVTEQERLAAEALPILVRLAELEAREVAEEVTSMQLVTSTAKTKETKKQEENK